MRGGEFMCRLKDTAGVRYRVFFDAHAGIEDVPAWRIGR
jgi:hypothetical protein